MLNDIWIAGIFCTLVEMITGYSQIFKYRIVVQRTGRLWYIAAEEIEFILLRNQTELFLNTTNLFFSQLTWGRREAESFIVYRSEEFI